MTLKLLKVENKKSDIPKFYDQLCTFISVVYLWYISILSMQYQLPIFNTSIFCSYWKSFQKKILIYWQKREKIKDLLDYTTLLIWAKEKRVSFGESIPNDKAKFDMLQLL